MADSEIEQLRGLRAQARRLSATLVPDLAPFLHADGLTFRKLPTSPKDQGLSATTTCSCLMALAMGNSLASIYGNGQDRIQECVSLLFRSPWRTATLRPGNAFTTSIVLRAASHLVHHGAIGRDFALSLVHAEGGRSRSITDIVHGIAKRVPQSFSIEKTPAHPAIGYWFLDAVDKLELDLPRKSWNGLAEWGRNEFQRQRELVDSDEAVKDPVAMAMAACLCLRMRRLVRESRLGTDSNQSQLLPDHGTLSKALLRLFEYQEEFGLWPKYYPFFIHENETAGNHCYTFELLEAVIHELGYRDNEVMFSGPGLRALERLLRWCDKNRFEVRENATEYKGWHSGGERDTYNRRLPESWATAVVHMFLREADWRLRERLQSLHLVAYGVIVPTRKDDSDWHKLIDTPLELVSEKQSTSVKSLLEREIVSPLSDLPEWRFRNSGIRSRHSVFLFGPPGTAKTFIVRAVAAALGWPIIELSPGDFLKEGVGDIFKHTDRVFRDLMELERVVIFFDEMEEFVRDRRPGVDLLNRFLTDAMLPALASLYKQQHVLCFLATNHREIFDSAITRSGRFDLWICVGPPPFEAKLERLDLFLPHGTSKDEIPEIKSLLTSYAGGRDNKIHQVLDLFSALEFKALLGSLRADSTLANSLREMGAAEFVDRVLRSSENVILRVSDKNDADSDYSRYMADRQMSKRQ